MSDSGDVVEMLFGFLKEKPKALAQVSSSLKELSTIQAGLSRLREVIEDPNEDRVNLEKSVLALTKSMQTMAKLLNQNTICLLMYMSVGDFDIDAGKLLTKMGHGKEALRAVWEKKMGGQG